MVRVRFACSAIIYSSFVGHVPFLKYRLLIIRCVTSNCARYLLIKCQIRVRQCRKPLSCVRLALQSWRPSDLISAYLGICHSIRFWL